MENTDIYLDNILKNNKLYKLNCMLDDCQSEDDIKFLKNLISFIKLDQTKNNIEITKKKKTYEIDNYLYKQPWKKLHISLKTKKLNEFLDTSILETSKENFKEIKKLLLDKLKSNKLKKVIYDSYNSKILSIEKLKYSDNKYIYED